MPCASGHEILNGAVTLVLGVTTVGVVLVGVATGGVALVGGLMVGGVGRCR